MIAKALDESTDCWWWSESPGGVMHNGIGIGVKEGKPHQTLVKYCQWSVSRFRGSFVHRGQCHTMNHSTIYTNLRVRTLLLSLPTGLTDGLNIQP